MLYNVIETEKYDAKPTYKKIPGYRPGVAVIGDLIVGIGWDRLPKSFMAENTVFLLLTALRGFLWI